MTIEALLSQQAVSAFLLSWWKVLLMLPPFMAWAWLVATKLDKDARYFHFNIEMWNGIHLAAGALALAAMLFIPSFWLSWPAGVIILLAPILAYWRVRDQKLPEAQRFKLTGEGLGAKLTARRHARASQQALIEFIDTKGATRQVPLKDDVHYPTHMLAEDVLGPALAARAARVEVVAASGGATIRQFVDGIAYKRETIPADAAIKVIDYLKDIA